MSNSLKLRPKHFSKGSSPSASLIYGPAYLVANCAQIPTLSSPDKTISAISVKSTLHKGKRWHSTAD